jgi:serine/threonine-protein kinase RsbW
VESSRESSRTPQVEGARVRETPPSAALREPADPGATGVEPRDKVRITLPADGAYLSVLRTATAALASRLDFTLDDIEDLRIAVDEACALLLTSAVPGADITCEFEVHEGVLQVCVSALTEDGQEPPRDTFAWMVLTALAGEVDSSADADHRVTLQLRKAHPTPRRAEQP